MHKTSFELTMHSILHTSSTNYTHTLFLSPAYLEQVPAVWISVHHARLQKLRQCGVYTQLHQRHVGCGSPPTRAATASAAASLACRVVVMSATRDVCIPMPALQESSCAPADSKLLAHDPLHGEHAAAAERRHQPRHPHAWPGNAQSANSAAPRVVERSELFEVFSLFFFNPRAQ